MPWLKPWVEDGVPSRQPTPPCREGADERGIWMLSSTISADLERLLPPRRKRQRGFERECSQEALEVAFSLRSKPHFASLAPRPESSISFVSRRIHSVRRDGRTNAELTDLGLDFGAWSLELSVCR